MDSKAEIDALVNRFIRDLEELFRREAVTVAHDALRSALGVGRAPAASSRGGAPARAPKPERRAKSGGKRHRRSPAEIDQMASQILDHVKKNPGQRAEAIKKALGLSTKDWMLPVKKLVDEKILRVKGEKRATTYTAA